MIASTHEKFIAIETGRGVTIRTAGTLKELITELILNSGEEIALWAEGEGKRVADVWRAEAAKEAKRSCNRHEDCDAAEREYIEKKHPQGITPNGIADKRMYLPVDFHCHNDECEECFGN